MGIEAEEITRRIRDEIKRGLGTALISKDWAYVDSCVAAGIRPLIEALTEKQTWIDEAISSCARRRCSQRDARIAELEQWVADLQAGMYVNCVYCGHRYGPDDQVPVSMAEALKEHIERCPKHPMSAMRERLEAAENVCEELNASADVYTAPKVMSALAAWEEKRHG